MTDMTTPITTMTGAYPYEPDEGPVSKDAAATMQVAEAPKKAGKYDNVEKELLFHLNDVDYYIPKEIPPSVVFSYLRDARRGGAEMAFANMFVDLCGEDALDALAEHDGMKTKEMQALIKALQKRVMGALELGN